MRSDIRRNLGFLFAGTFALALALALLATVTWSPQPAAASVTGADVVTVASGDWSDTSTWSTGDVPQAGQSVEVAAGHVVTFDADAVVQRLDIFGVLKFSRTTSTRLESAGNIIVREGGELLAGTPDNPLPWNVDATIVFDVQNGEDFVGGAMFDESDTGLWVSMAADGNPTALQWNTPGRSCLVMRRLGRRRWLQGATSRTGQ